MSTTTQKKLPTRHSNSFSSAEVRAFMQAYRKMLLVPAMRPISVNRDLAELARKFQQMEDRADGRERQAAE